VLAVIADAVLALQIGPRYSSPDDLVAWSGERITVGVVTPGGVVYHLALPKSTGRGPRGERGELGLRST